MPRSYFRTLPDLYERKAFGTDRHPPYPPGALACFLGALCFGEQQNPRGRFKSKLMLEALIEGPKRLGRLTARHVAFLIDQGDLVPMPDGSLYIEGWDELQEGNWQVAERMSRYRDRQPTVTVPTVTPTRLDLGTVTDDPSRVVGVMAEELLAEGRKGGNGDAPPPHTPRQIVHHWLTEHGASPPTGWVIKALDELVKVYGPSSIVNLWSSAPPDVRTSRQYVQYAERSLAPSSNGHRPGAGHTRTAQEVEDVLNR